jgi:hypothetical protein
MCALFVCNFTQETQMLKSLTSKVLGHYKKFEVHQQVKNLTWQFHTKSLKFEAKA